jgi:hypothetical protein
MALPTSLSTCTVIGTYVDLLGNPVSGSINFTPQTILKETTENFIIIPVVIQRSFDASGSFTVTLPVTSDTDVAPQPFIYTVEENFTGGRTFQLSLPLSVAGTTQNLADLLPAVLAAESASYVTVDQYQAILTRYTEAEATRLIVVNADTKDALAASNATDTATAASLIGVYNQNQLMMMGV